MDPLSDVLAMLRVDSLLSSRFEGRGPWNLWFPGYASQLKFGCVLSGRLHLKVTGQAKAWITLDEGDFYLLTNGKPFHAASDRKHAERDGTATFRAHRDADGVVRFGKHGPLVSLASGRFEFTSDAGELLLRHLPPLIHVRARAPGAEALAGVLALLRTESDEASSLGAGVARASLASLVLVQLLRVFLEHTPQPEGWLGAMSDARIGAALSAMHDDLAQPWTVESLARVAGMSRTAFAVRFRQLAGATPLDYLIAWRMRVACRALVETDEVLARVAQRVGYLSETSFSAAFKRVTGQSPGRYRTAALASQSAAAR